MPRYFMHMSYVGTNYNGWQRQTNTPYSIQQVVEEALSKVFKYKVLTTGCGRTDQGVHASNYFFHLDLDVDLNEDHLFKLNKICPSDIAFHRAIAVSPNAHARFDATLRSYDYFIHFEKQPFLSPYSYFYDRNPLDLALMHSAAHLLSKTSDFANMCKSPEKHKTTIVHIKEVSLTFYPELSLIHFHISANRFLKSMIRIIVAKLIDVGSKNISIEEYEAYLQGIKKRKYLDMAPPQGLCLSHIAYPYFSIPTNTNLIHRLIN